MTFGMDISISPISDTAELSQLVEIEDAAYGKASPIMNLIFGQAQADTTDAVKPALYARIRRHHDLLTSDPTVRYLKAVVDHEGMVGFVVWHHFTATDAKLGQDPWHNLEEYFRGTGCASLRHEYFQCLTAARRHHLDGRSHLFLANLAVDPRYQGRGIGGRLLDEVLRVSSQEKLDIWCDASPTGVTLYQKKGWKEVGKLSFDLSLYGGKGVHVIKNMLRVADSR